MNEQFHQAQNTSEYIVIPQLNKIIREKYYTGFLKNYWTDLHKLGLKLKVVVQGSAFERFYVCQWYTFTVMTHKLFWLPKWRDFWINWFYDLATRQLIADDCAVFVILWMLDENLFLTLSTIFFVGFWVLCKAFSASKSYFSRQFDLI